MVPIQTIQDLLRTPKKVAVVIHQNPDGDALGSGIAMTSFLKKRGHDVALISPDTPPLFLTWMPGIEAALSFDEESTKGQAARALQEADLILCLDFPVLHRAGAAAPHIRASQAPKIVLDHHPDHEMFADIMWMDTQACATAALVYRMISALEGKELIDEDMATCLYVGVLTDTGSFQYANTTAEAHLVAGDLVQRGANLQKIRQHISPRQHISRVRFFSHMFLKRLVVMPKYEAAYFLLPRTDYLRLKLQPGDTSGLASEALTIEGVSLAVLLVEKDEKIHLSFRSIGHVPANQLAQKYFSGGGHLKAAGGACTLSLQKTEERLRKMIATEMPQYVKKM